MSDSGKAVFLSYASQDAEAAKRIADALRAGGVEVWFDTDGGLEHGDEWDAKIRRQIKECVLFIALVSANTQAREEGYFRIEWELAAQRAMGIASGVAFILPVVIDDTKEPAALVPDRFRSVQWTRLPGGNVPADVLQRFLKLWSHRAGMVKQQSKEPGAGNPELEAGRSRPAASGPKWLRPILASGAIVVAVLAFTLINRRGPEKTAPPATKAEAAVPAGAPTEAQQLVARVWELLNRPELGRAELGAADDLCKRAAALAPVDAEVAAAWSQVDSWSVYLGFDATRARQESARTKAERAMQFAPKSFEARLARACYLIRGRGVGGVSQFSPEAEPLLRGLLQERPAEPRALLALGICLRDQQRPADARATLEELARNPAFAALAWNEIGWAALFVRDIPAAEAAADKSIALQPCWPSVCLKLQIVLFIGGDVKEARAVLAKLPESALQEDYGAMLAMWVYVYGREWDQGVRVAAGVSREWLHTTLGDGPRSVYIGIMHHYAGHEALAEVEWRAALQLVEQRLAETPNEPILLHWKGWLLAALGDPAGGEKLLTLSRALVNSPLAEFEGFDRLQLGQLDEAVACFERATSAGILPGWFTTAASFRLDPRFDPLRGLPRFQALQARLDADPLFSAAARKRPPAAAPVAPPAIDARSVAVLAFANLSDDKANEYFSDGISEELLTVLQKIPGLHVAARTSAFSFKGSNATAPEIGAKLGVATLVEGSVRKAGTSVRITARLSRAATGEQLWSESYTRDLQDVFAVQSELAQTIVGQLRGQLGGTETKAEIQAQVQAAEKGGTRNAEAHQLYLQGKYLTNRSNYDDAMKATVLLQRAVDLDPKFALAWATLSNAGWVRGSYGDTRRDFDEGYALARRAADQAIVLEPTLPAGYLARLDIQSSTDFDWQGANESLHRAQELAPHDPAVIFRAAQLAYGFGREKEAIELGRQAVALDPVNAAVYVNQGYVLVSAGRFAEAEAAFRQLLDIRSDSPWGHAGLAMVMVAHGDFEQAAVEVLKQGTGWSRLYVQSMALWGQQKRAEADAALAQLVKEYGDVAAYQIACAYAFRGDADRAFEWLERAYQQKDPGLSWAKPDFFLRPLHADPRWDALMRKLGLADDQLK